MPSHASQTEIIAKAMILLGSTERLTTIDDAGPTADGLRVLWNIARRSALALHPWNFAIKRDKLKRDAAFVAVFGYANRFALPSDCLRWLPWATSDEFFFEGEEEDGYLLSDEIEPLPVRYIYDNIDWSKWSPLFADCMAYQLAFEYCESKTGLKGLRQSLRDEQDELMVRARRMDGLATGKRERNSAVRMSRWARARFTTRGILDS